MPEYLYPIPGTREALDALLRMTADWLTTPPIHIQRWTFQWHLGQGGNPAITASLPVEERTSERRSDSIQRTLRLIHEGVPLAEEPDFDYWTTETSTKFSTQPDIPAELVIALAPSTINLPLARALVQCWALHEAVPPAHKLIGDNPRATTHHENVARAIREIESLSTDTGLIAQLKRAMRFDARRYSELAEEAGVSETQLSEFLQGKRTLTLCEADRVWRALAITLP